MKVIVKTLDRNVVDVTVEDDSTLFDLKKSIQEIKNHPAEQMTIIFQGKKLEENDKKLSEYLIVDGASIVLMMTKPKPTVPTTPIVSTSTTSTASTASTVLSQVGTETQNASTDVSNELTTVSEPSTSATTSSPLLPGMNPVNMGGSLNQFLQQNPQLLMQMLMSNPQIAQMAPNQNALMQLINDPNFLNSIIQEGDEFEDDDPMYEKIFEGDVQLTVEQKKEVDEIINMGFGTYEDTIQLYVAYGYNKDATVNALLDDKFTD